MVSDEIQCVPFLSCGAYYDTPGLRDLAHRIKKSDSTAIRDAAAIMAAITPRGSALVPVPSRDGKPAHSFALALAISEISGAPVADILRGKERISQYAAKKSGYSLLPEELGFFREGDIPCGMLPALVDNVVGSGATLLAAARAAGKRSVGLVLAHDPAADAGFARRATSEDLCLPLPEPRPPNTQIRPMPSDQDCGHANCVYYRS